MRLDHSKSLVSDTDILEIDTGLRDYRATLRNVVAHRDYDALEASLLLPDDTESYDRAITLCTQKHAEGVKLIAVIGIGGSRLGTKAVYDALYGFTDEYTLERFPKLLFVGTNDTRMIENLIGLLKTAKSKEEILITIITKSGTTTETIANAELVIAALQEHFHTDILDRVVTITDEGSPLATLSQTKNIATLSIPRQVGGRYSVFSDVGLFPLLAGGIDVEGLRAGALEMRDLCLNEQGIKNPAIVSAAVLYKAQQAGKNININFFFHPELETLGKWYRQLMGESIGKERNRNDELVHTGITPEVAIGSTDLHSVAQLYLSGPEDKVTTFVSVDHVPQLCIPEDRIFEDLAPSISHKSAEGIMTAILHGTELAYEKAHLPYMEIILDEISPYSLGRFLQFKMIEMMYLGQLFNVNAFDQPNVELYKVETKHILEE